MKKTLIIPLLALGAGACIGCSNQEDFYKELQNFRPDNISDYQAIGVGSMAEPSNGKKGKRFLREKTAEQQASNERAVSLGELAYLKNDEYEESAYPFSLIGQLNDGEIRKLSFFGKEHSLNVPIMEYFNWGDFITFVPGNDIGIKEDQSKVYRLTKYRSILSLVGDVFTLSLNTGNIYKSVPLERPSMGSIVDCVKTKDGSTIFLFGDGAYKAYENEDGLNFKFLGEHRAEKLDRYGNILVDNGIITVSDSKLHPFDSYLEGQARIVLDDISKEIFAFTDNENLTYYLNENGEFVQTSACGLYNEFLMKGDVEINYKDQNTWDVSLLNSWLEENKEKINNYKELKENDLATLTKEQFLEAYRSMYKAKRISMLDNGNLVLCENPYYVPDYAQTIYDDQHGTFYALGKIPLLSLPRYQRLDAHSYLEKPLTDQDELQKFLADADLTDTIKRGNNLYSLSRRKHISKYSFEEDKTTEIVLETAFDIKTMECEDGQIILKGEDDSFNEFEGYLDLNDQISFEKTKSGILILTPIN